MRFSRPIFTAASPSTANAFKPKLINYAYVNTITLISTLRILVATNILLVPASGVSLGDIPILTYLVITTLATLISIVIGYIIGVFAKNQAQATLVSTPILVFFISTPVLKVFNETFAEILNYTYSGVLANLAETLSSSTEYKWNITDTSVLLAWLVLTLGIFMYVYKKNGLDSE